MTAVVLGGEAPTGGLATKAVGPRRADVRIRRSAGVAIDLLIHRHARMMDEAAGRNADHVAPRRMAWAPRSADARSWPAPATRTRCWASPGCSMRPRRSSRSEPRPDVSVRRCLAVERGRREHVRVVGAADAQHGCAERASAGEDRVGRTADIGEMRAWRRGGPGRGRQVRTAAVVTADRVVAERIVRRRQREQPPDAGIRGVDEMRLRRVAGRVVEGSGDRAADLHRRRSPRPDWSLRSRR